MLETVNTKKGDRYTDTTHPPPRETSIDLQDKAEGSIIQSVRAQVYTHRKQAGRQPRGLHTEDGH